jgi:hypothetical protein
MSASDLGCVKTASAGPQISEDVFQTNRPEEVAILADTLDDFYLVHGVADDWARRT